MGTDGMFASESAISTLKLARLPLLVLCVLFVLGLDTSSAAAAPCDAPIANEIVCENSKPGNPPSEWDVNGAGDANIQGFATDISVDQGETVHFKVDTDCHRLPPRHLPDGLLRRQRRPQGRDGPAVGEPAPDPARLPRTTRPTGLIDCGNWAESASWAVSRRRRLGDLLRQARARGRDRRGQPHLLHRPRRRRRLRPAVPDRGHHLAGLQPVRRQQPLRRLAGRAGPTRSATTARSPPAARTPRTRSSTPSTRWSAGSSETATTSATSPASTRDRNGRRDPRARGVPLRRPRRVLVGRAARQRRGRPRRRGQPRVLQRQRDLLEDPLGEQHRRVRHGAPDPGLLQGDPRQRQDRPDLDLDRDLARPAVRSTPRAASPRTRSPARSSRSTPAPRRSRCPRPTASCGSGGTPSVASLAPGQTRDARRDTLGYEWDEDLDNGSRPPGLVGCPRPPSAASSSCQDYGSNYGPAPRPTA